MKSKRPTGEVWRSLIIISASDEKEAVRKALEIGRADQGDSRGSLMLDGKAAVAKFLGIEDMGLIHDGLADGSEILFRSERSLVQTAKRGVKKPSQLRTSLKKEIGPYKTRSAAAAVY